MKITPTIEQLPIQRLVTRTPDVTRKKTIAFVGLVILAFAVIRSVVVYLQRTNSNKATPPGQSAPERPLPQVTATTKLKEGKKVIYSVLGDDSNGTRTIYAANLNSQGKKRIGTYRGDYEFGRSIPVVSKTGLVAYQDRRYTISTLDLEGNKKFLVEAASGFEFGDMMLSDDGVTLLYQEFEQPEPGQSCPSFNLWRVDLRTGNKDALYSNKTNYLKPIQVSRSGKKAFMLRGSLAGGDATCFGPAESLEILDLMHKKLQVIKTFRLSNNHPFTIELSNGIVISPDERYGVIAYSTHPGVPLISIPSKEYPVIMAILDLSTGKETTLVESAERYVHPVGWYSDSMSILYREEAADTVENYQTIQDAYKKIHIQSKQPVHLSSLDKRGGFMGSYGQLVNDSTLVYLRQQLSGATTLNKINLDGTNQVELDKQSRFIYLLGVTDN